MSDAGYSTTPPAKKIGVKAGNRVALVHRPLNWRIPDLPPDVTVADSDAVGADRAAAGADIVIAFYRSRAELDADAPNLAAQLTRGSMLWVAWPRRAGGHNSDLTGNDLRAVLLPTGLVDVKVAALDTDWSGLKFVWRTAPVDRG